ncbi:MAG: MarR family transcriptional regulator [Acidimicrobiia bacterium]
MSFDVDEPEVVLDLAAAIRELRRTADFAWRQLSGYRRFADSKQVDLLDQLASRDNQRVGELAVALKVDDSTATRAVQWLEQHGLAQRRPSPDDRRVVLVALTKAGRDLHAGVQMRRLEMLGQMLVDFSEDERHLLLGLLNRLIGAMEHHFGAASSAALAAAEQGGTPSSPSRGPTPEPPG